MSIFNILAPVNSGDRSLLTALPARGGVILAALATASLVSGCGSTRGGTVPYNVAEFGVPDTPTPLTLENDYRIAPLDTLDIKVFQVEDLSGEYEVDLTGNIAMPLIGSVKAVDRTPLELKNAIAQQLGAKYLQSPDVTVGVKTSTKRNVTVDGSVKLPGLFPINGPMTLMQAIALARGTDDAANPRRIAIFRQVDGKRMAAAFDLVAIRRGQAEDPQVYSGDIVIVDGSTSKALYTKLLQTLPLIGLFRPY